MKNNYFITIFFILLLLITQCKLAFASLNDYWVFYKVSNTDLFGNYDRTKIEDLRFLYGKVLISLNQEKITIDNKLLENPTICHSVYNRIKMKSISYFYSIKTLRMYEDVLNKEGVKLNEWISILEASEIDKSCIPPYNELIESGNFLIITDDSYVILFRKAVNDKIEGRGIENNFFSEYCLNKNNGRLYDGKSEYSCDFSKMNISESYYKIISQPGNNGLIKALPTKSIILRESTGYVSYKWLNNRELKVELTNGMEKTIYIFREWNDSTQLDVTTNSGY